jgi:hypothetical protein
MPFALALIEEFMYSLDRGDLVTEMQGVLIIIQCVSIATPAIGEYLEQCFITLEFYAFSGLIIDLPCEAHMSGLIPQASEYRIIAFSP